MTRKRKAVQEMDIDCLPVPLSPDDMTVDGELIRRRRKDHEPKT